MYATILYIVLQKKHDHTNYEEKIYEFYNEIIKEHNLSYTDKIFICGWFAGTLPKYFSIDWILLYSDNNKKLINITEYINIIIDLDNGHDFKQIYEKYGQRALNYLPYVTTLCVFTHIDICDPIIIDIYESCNRDDILSSIIDWNINKNNMNDNEEYLLR